MSDAAGALYRLQPVRIGLWDQYGGSMPSGHVRWLLEQFEFPFEVVYPGTLDAGNLKAKFDVLLFPDGGIPETRRRRGRGRSADSRRRLMCRRSIATRLGRVSLKQTIPQLKQFVEAGGAIVAFGGSAVLGHHLGLPVSDHLVEIAAGRQRASAAGRRSTTFPGSLLQRCGRQHQPAGYGMRRSRSMCSSTTARCWSWRPNASLRGVQPVAWFDSKTPLRSGWAWGQHYLEGGVAGSRGVARQGQGVPVRTGDHVPHQPHGTFKFLFNSIYYGTATPVGTPARETTVTAVGARAQERRSLRSWGSALPTRCSRGRIGRLALERRRWLVLLP